MDSPRPRDRWARPRPLLRSGPRLGTLTCAMTTATTAVRKADSARRADPVAAQGGRKPMRPDRTPGREDTDTPGAVGRARSQPLPARLAATAAAAGVAGTAVVGSVW